MIDLKSTIVKLIDSADPQHIEAAAGLILENIHDDKLQIKNLVIELNPLLTAGNYELRLRGVDLLSRVITNTQRSRFNEKEIQVLSEYLSDRLGDHKSMQRPVLKSFLYFVDCENKPHSYNHDTLGYLKHKCNVHNMDKENRSLVYQMIKAIIIQRRQMSTSIDSDLFYSLIHLIEGESEPENLMICFGIVSHMMKSFTNLEPFIDDLFEWLASYYPLDYTPDRTDSDKYTVIQKSDLTKALYDCFYANPLNSDNLQTLMLEKLDSNQPKSTKIESLNCLIELYELFPSVEVKDYATSLWTSVRTNCLMKIDMVDPALLNTCYRALSAMTKRLSDDSYFTFISDMHEELSIAIRKLEMDLFEPAIRLIAHAIQPRVVGFNFILAKILPTSIKAIAASDLRPAEGLSYIFEQLLMNHPDAKLIPELKEPLNELALQTSAHAIRNEGCLRLLNSIICCRIELDEVTLSEIISKLLSSLNRSVTDVQGSLALICAKYNRSDVIFNNVKSDCRIASLIKLVKFYKQEHNSEATNELTVSTATKFSIYLRLLVLLLDEIDQSSLNLLDQRDVNDLLKELRNLVGDLKLNYKPIENVGLIHAIMINKLSDELVHPMIMEIFQSEYCQNLVPTKDFEEELEREKYLPVVGPIFKSLVIRNHPLSEPMINLMLNFITSDRVSQDTAFEGARIFGQVLSESTVRFDEKKHYRTFVLYKQKFFTLLMKNIRSRLESTTSQSKRYLLVCSMALLIPHLPVSVYRKDSEWIVREILKVLIKLKDNINGGEEGNGEKLIPVLYECVECLIAGDCSENLTSFLGSLMELNLFYATEAKSMQIRRRALICSSIIATSFKQPELLVLRLSVLNQLKPCLADKKRIVRQAAAEARLKWFLVGQPIGSF